MSQAPANPLKWVAARSIRTIRSRMRSGGTGSSGSSIDEANRHFAAALASGREHDFARRLQLASLRNYTAPAVEGALLRAVDEMRRNGELIDEGTRRYMFGIYHTAFNSDVYLRRVLGAVPPQQHIETIRARYFDERFDPSQVPQRDAQIALLLARRMQSSMSRSACARSFCSRAALGVEHRALRRRAAWRDGERHRDEDS